MNVKLIINYLWILINIFVIIPFLVYHAMKADDIYYRIVLWILFGALILTEGYNIYILIKYHKQMKVPNEASAVISNDLVIT
jgi:hypothetical protein